MQKLNKEQLEAVGHGEGPMMIIAGAGTGKTLVITERIKRLVSEGLARADEILALTFTEKAAGEMQGRIDEVMPYGYTEMWISTFHSFCDRVLRDSALNVGLDPKYKLLTQAETVQFVRDKLFEFELDYFRPLGNPTKFVSGLAGHFSRLQDEDITPGEYTAWVNSKFKVPNSKPDKEEKLEAEKWGELAKAYKKFEEIKIREGRMDFGDLIVKSLYLFRKRPDVLSGYQKRFKFILVDEFQDVNYAQSELAFQLAGKRANIVVAGDDDQSIYRFRGAAVSNILEFRKRYPKGKMVVLSRNYRSSQEILDRAYRLIQFNNPDRLEEKEKIDKKLVAFRQARGEQIVLIHENRVENEAERVVKKIKELAANSPSREASEGLARYGFKDIAVLIRANNHAEPFVRALERAGVPYQFWGTGKLFRQREVRDLIAFLKVLSDPDDFLSMYQILSMEGLEIAVRDVIVLANWARKRNVSLFEACEMLAGGKVTATVTEAGKERIGRLIELVKKLVEKTRKESAGQLLYDFLEGMDLLAVLFNPDTVAAERRAMNISRFFDRLKAYEANFEDASVSAVVDWIELSYELGESPAAYESGKDREDAVNILTVHGSKGLEFKVVFLVNLVSQRFPTIERREQIPIPDELIKEELPSGDFHLQEERRLFYVGMTRARERLFLTAADYYGDGKREKKLSSFIFEALGDGALEAEIGAEGGEQLSFLGYKNDDTPKASHLGGQDFHIDYLSFSQIDTFQICPLHYKLRYILKIPTPPSAAMSFGTSIHNTMRDFYLEAKARKRGFGRLALELLDRNWVNLGYENRVHERKMREKAERFIEEYIKREFDPEKMPVAIEKPFIVPLPLRVNPPKAKQSGRPRALRIGGRIDRVDALSDGRIEIIDYKTGEKVPDQKKVDGDLQLTFYALAATSIGELPFNKKPEEVVLSLYYFEERKKISTTRSREQLEDVIEEIYKVREEIERSDFKCSGGYLCRNCEFRAFCESG